MVSSLLLDPHAMEAHNKKLKAKCDALAESEVRYEEIECEDAEYLLVAYGSSSRICQKTVQLGRKKGIKVGLLRPITLFPFPAKILEKRAQHVKGIMSVEMSTGQMVEA